MSKIDKAIEHLNQEFEFVGLSDYKIEIFEALQQAKKDREDVRIDIADLISQLEEERNHSNSFKIMELEEGDNAQSSYHEGKRDAYNKSINKLEELINYQNEH